jgi:hypothetical protein
VEGEIVMAAEGVSTMVRVAITSLRVYSIELATRTKMMIVPTRMKAPHVGISTGTGPRPSPRLKRDMPEACSKPRRTTWPTYATIVNYVLDKQVTNEKRTETALIVEEKLKKK